MSCKNTKYCIDCKYFINKECEHPHKEHCNYCELWTPIWFRAETIEDCINCIHYNICIYHIKCSEFLDKRDYNRMTTAKRAIYEPDMGYLCPICSSNVDFSDNFCCNCGQALDWSD